MATVTRVLMARATRSLMAARAGRRLQFEGKVAVLAGATDGIGYAIADRLAEDGAKIMISSRKQANVDRALDSLRNQYGNESVAGTVCHVGKEEDRRKLIQEAVKKFGRIDLLIDNAGVNPSGRETLTATHSQWTKLFDINVIAAALLVQEAYPYLKEKGGSVVFVSSLGGYEPESAYAVSKTALIGLTKALARELAVDNVRVNCIAPGVIRTEFGRVMWEDDVVRERVLSDYWIKRVGEPEECAGMVSFFCSEDSSFITGECVTISGKSPAL